MELLLSISLGHWFESFRQPRTQDDQILESEKIGRRKERFREKLRDARNQLLTVETMASDAFSQRSIVPIHEEGVHQSKLRELIESVSS